MSILSNLTPRAQHALQLAANVADKMEHSYVGTEHLFLAILDQNAGAAKTLQLLGIDTAKLRRDFAASFATAPQPAAPDEPVTPVPLAPPVPPVPSVRPPVLPTRSLSPQSQPRHYLLADDSCFFQCALAKTQGEETVDFRDLPTAIWDTPFVYNLSAREPAFTNRQFRTNQGWIGWSVSSAEYTRLLRLLELRPGVEEYNRLAGSVIL